MLQTLVEPETAGDPMSAQKWVRSSLRQLSTRLRDAGHPVSPPTVGRLLEDMGYALHVNAKPASLNFSPAHDLIGHTFGQVSWNRAGQPKTDFIDPDDFSLQVDQWTA